MRSTCKCILKFAVSKPFVNQSLDIKPSTSICLFCLRFNLGLTLLSVVIFGLAVREKHFEDCPVNSTITF